MERKDFLRFAGAAGLASMLPGRSHGEPTEARDDGPAPRPLPDGGCVLIPSETAGPFPLDLSANTFYFRQDIREDRAGAPHRLRLRILGLQDCLPMQNVRVNIWHCDADGVYSGYTNQNGGVNSTGQTFLRGYQFTDANGEAEFLTIFPGWYPGRVCHIHFQVYVSSNYAAISQLTYPIAEKQAVYTDNPTLYTAGTDPVTPSQDGIFSDGYQYQEATLAFNGDTQEYDSFLEVTVQGTGLSTGLEELRNAEQFILGQNFPNPYVGETTVPFTLKTASDVKLELFDVSGKKVAVIQRENMPAGEQRLRLDLAELGLENGNYVYQLSVMNSNGTFRQCKMMTAKR
jgi:hypothetical protein